MIYCRICESENPDNTDKCLSCGAPLDRETARYTGDALEPGTLLDNGRYSVGKRLGQGGFGITYLGSDLTDQKTVAIKELFIDGCQRRGTTLLTTRKLTKESFEAVKTRFLQEGEMLMRFNHPGIVEIKSVFEENETAYISMEYLKGRSLHDIIQNRGKLSEAEAVNYAVNIAEALAEIHKQNIIHRDVKPDNIIVTDNGRTVLIDFGTAREYAANQTKAMTSWLTPGYAPLEQYSQKGHFNPSTDMYSLGATLYHMVTGQMPEQATDRVLKDTLVPPDAINPSITRSTSDAIMWAMQMDPEQRPQSSAEFLNALGGVIPIGTTPDRQGSGDTVFIPPGGVPVGSQPVFRKYLPAMLVVASIIIVVMIGISMTSNSGNQSVEDTFSPGPDPHGSVSGDLDAQTGDDQSGQAAEAEEDPMEETEETVPVYTPPSQITGNDATQFLYNWVAVWESQDIGQYRALYDSSSFIGRNFSPSTGWRTLNYNDWMADKSAKFSAARTIDITVSNVDIDVNNQRATITFTQDYRSNTYHDTGTKVLVIEHINGALKIISESWEP